MKTILVIDDDQNLANIIVEAICEKIAGVNCEVIVDFAQAEQRIIDLKPDAIVLDLMEDGKSINLPGEVTWQSVWNHEFCPIVIYTASDAELTPPVPPEHPFVRRIQKGSGAEKLVADTLVEFAPALGFINELQDEVNAVIQQVLRDTAGEGHVHNTNLLHAGRRRLAASMDAPTVISKRKLVSWEQYLIPPIGSSPLSADLLRISGAATDDPSSYRLVLTPSCDLVRDRSNENVLLAKCAHAHTLVKKMSLSTKDSKRGVSVERFIKEALTTGVYSGYVALPEFPGIFPCLTANLKDLEIIPYASIVPPEGIDAKYDRIASIDSPFREQIAWAYLTTAARPGMPDRDLHTWAHTVFKNDAGTTE